MKTSFFVAVFVTVFSSQDASAGSRVQCEPVRRVTNAGGQNYVDRGVRIHYEVRSRPDEAPVFEDAHSLWFGRNPEARDHGLRLCVESAQSLECRNEGVSRTSYGRGGVSATIRGWILFAKGRGVIDRFEDPILPFQDSAYERCMSSLIEEVAKQLRTVGGRD